jgi:hypothetical protein
MSRFVQLLVRVHFLPVRLAVGAGGAASFRLCSREALAAFAIYYLSCVVLYLLNVFFFFFSLDDRHRTAVQSVDIVDILSKCGQSLSTFLTLPALPLLLGRSVALAPLVTLSALVEG